MRRQKRIRFLTLIAPCLLLLSTSCGDLDRLLGKGDSDPVIPAAATARYRVTFTATWSASTHPTDFPPNPHFSGLIGGTHNNFVRFWQSGQTASNGIESMAETGQKTLLQNEVQAAIGSGFAEFVLSGGGVNPSPGSVSLDFDISQNFSLVTLVTMIAPSPDWFLGVSALQLFENGNWVSSKTVDLLPYDAGSDSGTTFASPDSDTNPKEVIARILGHPLSFNGTVAPLGTFTFTRL